MVQDSKNDLRHFVGLRDLPDIGIKSHRPTRVPLLTAKTELLLHSWNRPSEIETKFGFLQTKITGVNFEYNNFGKTSMLKNQCGHKKTLGERNHVLPTSIISYDMRAISRR